jgi:hypothetical protein
MRQRMRQGLYSTQKISKMKANATFITLKGSPFIGLSIYPKSEITAYYQIWLGMEFSKFEKYLSKINGGLFTSDETTWTGYIEHGDVKLHFAGTWQQVAEEAVKAHGIKLAGHICKEITTLELEIESVSFLNSEIKGNDAE